VQEAFVVALERWPRDGVPDNPGGWIARVARNSAIDRLRRDRRYEEKLRELAALGGPEEGDEDDMTSIPDDRLRLFFTCCHPALAPDARVALTLRTLGGLSTGEVARAFLTSESAMQQRIVRAKRKIAGARIPYEVPEDHQLPERLESVLSALYLVFNEGYLASAGDALIRQELCAEAIRLARVLLELMPDESEVRGLLALMLLTNARREARTGPGGEMVLLPDQDRSLWNREELDEGAALVEAALRAGPLGVYTLQAAVAEAHGRAPRAEDTDWSRIARLYDALLAIEPTPVIALNRAVAVSLSEGPEAGLALVDELMADGRLARYHLLHTTRADLLAKLGRGEDAAEAYRSALELAANPVERRFIEGRLAEL
jgi:RNA polymerase sigma-70 factor (ECF subfamily)